MTRRQLQLNSLDDIAAELDRLAGGGYEKAGRWDLAQVCDHLAYFVRGSLEGISEKVPWYVRVFVGRRSLQKLLKGEPIPEGIAIPDMMVPPPGGDAAAAVQGLKELFERFKGQPQLYPSPFFGTLTRDQWLKLHILHANHHLSFLIPAGDSD